MSPVALHWNFGPLLVKQCGDDWVQGHTDDNDACLLLRAFLGGCLLTYAFSISLASSRAAGEWMTL